MNIKFSKYRCIVMNSRKHLETAMNCYKQQGQPLTVMYNHEQSCTIIDHHEKR